MYIHAGNRFVVSDKNIIGIFNTATILMSDENRRYFDKIKPGDKTIIIDKLNKSIITGVSSFTVINRTGLKGNFMWRKKDDSFVQGG